MDLYHSVHGHDVSSFDLPSTHRLPTVSAAQAIEELDGNPSRYISTGLEALDNVLANQSPGFGAPDMCPGGIQKGQVTEIWGPPGAGKSILGVQIAANALRRGEGVIWVADAFHPMSHGRLSALSQGLPGDDAEQQTMQQTSFAHFTCATLHHFIALLCRPAPACVPPDTTLIVIDSLSALINHAFPRLQEAKGSFKAGSKAPSPAARRLQLLQYIIGALQKLSAARNIAIVILTQCATRMQAESGATLIPAINAGVWEQGVSTRLVLFRDWTHDHATIAAVHCVGVQKLDGKANNGAIGAVVAFDITPTGLSVKRYDGNEQPLRLGSASTYKRKLGDTSFEVPDSDDEDYGWQLEDDNSMPRMPPQWQGSEDILLGEQPSDSNASELSGDDGEVDDAANSENR
ncbi:uncharacterized protein E0L32_007265 [Thyridium curvatum]|uniref:RecA family profile 1 domain-containing protein n=1 Tax=Thyridium curvatum TaxID=1093900 RepID=A0A507APT1_9PEZI|nr:uncharacterized protein E0L32_007265 [Thyridium curvatum]TPX11962.1 hypothetical protein E0L32_007265 [Thyridium curvatum]